MFAPILPRPIIPSCIFAPLINCQRCCASGHRGPSAAAVTMFLCSFRYRRIKLFVELSWPSEGSALLSSSGMMRWASTLPSSTPHWSNELICQMAPWVKTECS